MSDDARPAFLFQSDDGALRAVALNASGIGLPALHEGCWQLLGKFMLGVQEPTPMGVAPEPILRGIVAKGYFVYSTDGVLPFGTSQ